MDFLWSPWRYRYVSTPRDSEACVFCIGDTDVDDSRKLVLHRGRFNFVIMNMYPYTSGHLMVVPYAHVSRLSDTDPSQMDEMNMLSRRSVEVLEEVYRPEGFNLGMNLGRCAGAGIEEHLHLHVVPRWCGDVNFITVTGETRVLPEDLGTSYDRLKRAF